MSENLFKRPVNGKRATTIPLKKAVVFDKDIYMKLNVKGVSNVSLKNDTKDATIKKASVFGANIKAEHIESAEGDITLNKLFDIHDTGGEN